MTPLIDTEAVRAVCLQSKATWTPTTNAATLASLKAMSLEQLKARLGANPNQAELDRVHSQPAPNVNTIVSDFRSRLSPGVAAALAPAPVAGKAGATAGATATAGGSPRPSKVDWRNYKGRNGVTAVQDQGQCGSCVAFGTSAALESMLLLEHNVTFDLSEADLFFCNGCRCANGWNASDAVSAVQSKGVPPSSCFPYPAVTENNGTDVPCSPCVAWAAMAAKATRNTCIYDTESRKQYLANVGPMIACFEVFEDFYTFFYGRSSANDIYTHVTGSDVGGHCIEIIGYDDTRNCWICKNSWGPGDPGNGFFLIGYGQCGIDTDSTFLFWTWGSPFWGLWGTTYARSYINKVVLGDTSPKSPALASLNGRLYLAWKGDGNDFLNVMYSSDNGRTFGNKYTSKETSPQAPALCVHNGNLYISWKGDGNDNLNVAQVTIAGNSITGFANKVTLGDTSPLSTSMASFNGRLYLAWKGDGNDFLNVEYSSDNGRTFGNKYTSKETSPQAPALCVHNANLYISWKGDGNDNLNVAQVTIAGNSITGFANKVTLGDTSPLSPALASCNNRLNIGWKGDGNDNLNVEYSTDNGRTFGSKFTSEETSPQFLALCMHNNNLYVAWKGDGNDNLNVGPLIPCPMT